MVWLAPDQERQLRGLQVDVQPGGTERLAVQIGVADRRLPAEGHGFAGYALFSLLGLRIGEVVVDRLRFGGVENRVVRIVAITFRLIASRAGEVKVGPFKGQLRKARFRLAVLDVCVGHFCDRRFTVATKTAVHRLQRLANIFLIVAVDNRAGYFGPLPPFVLQGFVQILGPLRFVHLQALGLGQALHVLHAASPLSIRLFQQSGQVLDLRGQADRIRLRQSVESVREREGAARGGLSRLRRGGCN